MRLCVQSASPLTQRQILTPRKSGLDGIIGRQLQFALPVQRLTQTSSTSANVRRRAAHRRQQRRRAVRVPNRKTRIVAKAQRSIVAHFATVAHEARRAGQWATVENSHLSLLLVRISLSEIKEGQHSKKIGFPLTAFNSASGMNEIEPLLRTRARSCANRVRSSRLATGACHNGVGVSPCPTRFPKECDTVPSLTCIFIARSLFLSGRAIFVCVLCGSQCFISGINDDDTTI